MIAKAKAKKTTVKKARPARPSKPKKVTMLDTELEPLKEADSLLGQIEKAESVCDEKLIEVDQIREQLKQAKGAYSHAVTQLRKLCRARKEKHPLFDQAKPEEKPTEKPEAKPVATTESQAVTVTVTVGGLTENHGLEVGSSLPVWLVKPGGLLVMSPAGNPVAITDDEYTADERVAGLIAEARDTGALSDADKWATLVAIRSLKAPVEALKPANDGWKALPLDAAGINGKGGKLLMEAGYETLGAVAKLMADYGQWWNKEVKGIGEETATEIADRFAEFWASHPEYCEQVA